MSRVLLNRYTMDYLGRCPHFVPSLHTTQRGHGTCNENFHIMLEDEILVALVYVSSILIRGCAALYRHTVPVTRFEGSPNRLVA